MRATMSALSSGRRRSSAASCGPAFPSPRRGREATSPPARIGRGAPRARSGCDGARDRRIGSRAWSARSPGMRPRAAARRRQALDDVHQRVRTRSCVCRAPRAAGGSRPWAQRCSLGRYGPAGHRGPALRRDWRAGPGRTRIQRSEARPSPGQARRAVIGTVAHAWVGLE